MGAFEIIGVCLLVFFGGCIVYVLWYSYRFRNVTEKMRAEMREQAGVKTDQELREKNDRETIDRLVKHCRGTDGCIKTNLVRAVRLEFSLYSEGRMQQIKDAVMKGNYAVNFQADPRMLEGNTIETYELRFAGFGSYFMVLYYPDYIGNTEKLLWFYKLPQPLNLRGGSVVWK